METRGVTPCIIHHDRERSRFVTEVDGHPCELDYVLHDGVMTITHTGVPEAVSGRGIASALVGAAFEAAREAGWRVDPRCGYGAVWVKRHPEVAALLA